MKNKITKYILLAFICLGLQACLFQEDDLFEKSSANRASENVAELQELLVNVPNGWKWSIIRVRIILWVESLCYAALTVIM